MQLPVAKPQSSYDDFLDGTHLHQSIESPPGLGMNEGLSLPHPHFLTTYLLRHLSATKCHALLIGQPVNQSVKCKATCKVKY